jgi:hypothetical protein
VLNSGDPSASIYAVQIALSVYQKEQLLAESYYHSDDNTSRNGAYLQHLSLYWKMFLICTYPFSFEHHKIVVSVLRDAPQNGVRNKAYKMVVSDSVLRNVPQNGVRNKACYPVMLHVHWILLLCLGLCLDGKKSLKKIAHYSSHRIFGRMYGALNIGKKITNCTVCL